MTRLLKVKFTREEIAVYAAELARETHKLVEIGAQKKQVMAALKAREEDAKNEVVKLARYVTDGCDYRDIECSWIMNFPRVGQKTLWRKDTERHEFDVVEGMTPAELQQDLPFEEDKK